MNKILIHFTVNKMVKVAPPDPLHIYYGFQIVVLWDICRSLRSLFFSIERHHGNLSEWKSGCGGGVGGSRRKGGRENYNQVIQYEKRLCLD